MAYENLLKSVEESAQERERELREKARYTVQSVSEETKSQAAVIQQALFDEVMKRIAVEKNKLIYITKGENKEKLIKAKESVFTAAAVRAEERLSQIRKDPKYPDILKKFAREAFSALGGESVIVHIDKQDEHIIKGILSDLHLSGEIIGDLRSAGGVVVSTPNDSIKISNTIESRLERVKEHKKLQIYTVLFGD